MHVLLNTTVILSCINFISRVSIFLTGFLKAVGCSNNKNRFNYLNYTHYRTFRTNTCTSSARKKMRVKNSGSNNKYKCPS